MFTLAFTEIISSERKDNHMFRKPIVMIGNGGHAGVLTEILLNQNYNIIGYTAPQKEINRFNIPYLGIDEVIQRFSPEDIHLVLGIGQIGVDSIRLTLFKYFKDKGYFFESIIHKSAIISSSAILGEGVQIMAGVIIQPFVKIADNTLVNTRASIDHDCEIGPNCHLAPGTVFSGKVFVGENSHIGTAATVIENIKIGSRVLIGAGSVVVNDILDNSKVLGVPARNV